MGSVVEYIENNPQETQRLIGLKYDSLQQLPLFNHSKKGKI